MMRFSNAMTPNRLVALQRAQARILKRARDQERLREKPLTAQQQACRVGGHYPLDMGFFGLRCGSCQKLVFGI